MLRFDYFRYNEPMKAASKSPHVSKTSSKVTESDIHHIAKLANVPLTPEQAGELTEQVGVTVEYVSHLASLDTSGVTETSQVTGMENVFREDVVDESRMFTQEEALANASRTHQGFFVVDRVLEEK